jgi:excisionase family DNA binding protein
MEPVTTTVKGAADALGVCPATIYNWMKEQRIETVRVGGRRLVKISSIRKLVGEAA